MEIPGVTEQQLLDLYDTLTYRAQLIQCLKILGSINVPHPLLFY